MEAIRKPEELTINELKILLEHLKLGADHLKKVLPEADFNALLKWGNLDEKQKTILKANRLERISEALPALNTIITSTFGAFLGFNAMLGTSISSRGNFAITCALASLIGGSIGYISATATQKKAMSATFKFKIHKVRLQILRVLKSHYEKKISHLITNLNTLLLQLRENFLTPSSSTCQFDNEKEIAEFLKELQDITVKIAQKLPFEKTYKHPHINLFHHFSQILFLLTKEKENPSYLAEVEKSIDTPPLHQSQENQKPSFIEILTDPSLAASKRSQNPPSKLGENPPLFFVGLIPTLLGSFASMFVFFNGIPDLAREFENFRLQSLLTNSSARTFELVLMVVLTVYLGASFFYAHLRAQERSHEISSIYHDIISEETLAEISYQRMLLLWQVRNHLSSIFQIKLNLEQISTGN